MAVSVTTPISDAADHVVKVLFTRFELRTWFVMGFSAWLTSLGQGGWSNSVRIVNQGSDWVPARIDYSDPAVAAVIAGSAVVLLVLVVGLTWLSSRGVFMFIDNVVTEQARIAEPWREYRAEANRLFALRLVLGVVLLAALALPGWSLLQAFESGAGLAALQWPLVSLIAGIMLVAMVVGFVIHNFVVPIMYLRHCTLGQAWNEATATIGAHIGHVILFGVLQFILTFLMAALVVAATCLMCCLPAIPYLGSVLLLPLLMFARAFPLFFLGQLGEPYRRFRTMGPDVDHVAQTFE